MQSPITFIKVTGKKATQKLTKKKKMKNKIKNKTNIL